MIRGGGLTGLTGGNVIRVVGFWWDELGRLVGLVDILGSGLDFGLVLWICLCIFKFKTIRTICVISANQRDLSCNFPNLV